MKVAISCDELIEKTHVIELVELMSELFPHSEIYTLVHRQGVIPGKLEMRKIHSSFLSHKVDSREKFMSSLYSVPTAAKNLFIPCSVDLIVNISSGLSQGIRKCDSTKMITYFYSDEFLNRKPKGIFQKFFKSYVNNWACKQLSQADKVYFSTETLMEDYGEHAKNAKVLPPSLKLDDFKLFPEGMFEHDYVLINTSGLSDSLATIISQLLEDLELKYRFVGEDHHLKQTKSKYNGNFLGKKCVGEMAPIYAGSKFYIDLEADAFPSSSLSCLATGRPVLVSKNKKTLDFLKGEGVCFVNPQNKAELANILKDFSEKSNQWEGQKLRAPTSKFNEIRFKSKLKRDVDTLLAN